MEKLLKSKAFWTAFVSTLGVLVMRYTAIPEEVWQSIAALLAVVTAIFTVDDLEKGIGMRLREMRDEMRQMKEAFLLYERKDK